MAHLIHITRAQERWDNIAHQYYRDATQVPRLLEANPHAPKTALLPAGLSLRIPLIEQASRSEALPPWRRSRGN